MKKKNRDSVGYVRTATTVDLTTLANQQAEILKHCIAEGLDLKAIFFDNGAPSNRLDRKGWDSMLKYLEDNNGKIRSIVVANVDRISRDYSVFRMAERTVGKYGAKICPCHQSDLSMFRQIIKGPKGKRPNRSLSRNR